MKAFVFTLDALFAVTLALAALATAASLLGPGSGPAEPLELQRSAQESTAYLDGNRTLFRLFTQTAAEGNATLAASLPAALPSAVGGRLTVSLYEYDAEDDQFTLLRTVGTIAGSEPSGGARGSSRRMFIGNSTYGPGGQKDYFGLATIETWFG